MLKINTGCITTKSPLLVLLKTNNWSLIGGFEQCKLLMNWTDVNRSTLQLQIYRCHCMNETHHHFWYAVVSEFVKIPVLAISADVGYRFLCHLYMADTSVTCQSSVYLSVCPLHLDVLSYRWHMCSLEHICSDNVSSHFIYNLQSILFIVAKSNGFFNCHFYLFFYFRYLSTS